MARLNAHSSSAANSMHQEGKKSGILRILFNPLIRFFKFYVLRRGFLEGVPGLMVAVLESYYVFLKYLKLWEYHRQKKS